MKFLFSKALGITQLSQEHLKTIVYAKCCIGSKQSDYGAFENKELFVTATKGPN